MARITNHRRGEVHLPSTVDPKSQAVLGKGVMLHPGVNEVDDAVWNKVKNHSWVKAMLEDEQIEVGGKPSLDTIPGLADFIAEGNEPATYKDRFPNAKVDEKDIVQAQIAWDSAKAAEARSKKGGKSEPSGKDDDAQAELDKMAEEAGKRKAK